MFSNSTLEQPTGNISATVTNDQDCLGRESTLTEVVFKAVAFFVIMLVSLIGNIMVLIITYKNKQLRKTINYFVFNMAVSDLFIPLTIMPVTIVHIISGSKSWKVDSPWLLGNILCKLSYFLPDVSIVVSIESLLLISVDRFISAVSPLNTTLKSTKARFISILCTWSISIAVHAPYFYTFRLFPYGNQTFQCLSYWGPAFNHDKTHKIYITATFITFFMIPICILAIMYGTIAWILKKKNKRNKGRLSYQQLRREQQIRKIIRMSVALVISFFVCMIPSLVLVFIRVFLWNWNDPPICAFQTVVPFIAKFMVQSWSALNPCICLMFMKIYRNSFIQLLPI